MSSISSNNATNMANSNKSPPDTDVIEGQQADLDEETAEEVPDNEDQIDVEKMRTLLHQFPLNPSSPQAQCGACERLNPAINGVILKKQRVRLVDEAGQASGRWVMGEVKIRAVNPKKCAPENNEQCPARELKMVVGVNVENLARKMFRAENQEDDALMAEISSQVALIDDDLKKEYRKILKRLRTEADHATS